MAVVYLLDVDNTLLDNDAVTDDLRRHMTAAFGEEAQRRYLATPESGRLASRLRSSARPV